MIIENLSNIQDSELLFKKVYNIGKAKESGLIIMPDHEEVFFRKWNRTFVIIRIDFAWKKSTKKLEVLFKLLFD